jgi:hypothetical protein
MATINQPLLFINVIRENPVGGYIFCIFIMAKNKTTLVGSPEGTGEDGKGRMGWRACRYTHVVPCPPSIIPATCRLSSNSAA